MRIDVYHHIAFDADTQTQLDSIYSDLQTLLERTGNIMATTQEVMDKLTQASTDAANEALQAQARADAAAAALADMQAQVANLSGQVTALQDQVAALQAAGAGVMTQPQLDAMAAQVDTLDEAIKAIIPDTPPAVV